MTDFVEKFNAVELALITEFLGFREEVDQEYLLDTFDIALGWFSGKGLLPSRAIDIAGHLNDMTLRASDELEGTDRPLRLV